MFDVGNSGELDRCESDFLRVLRGLVENGVTVDAGNVLDLLNQVKALSNGKLSDRLLLQIVPQFCELLNVSQGDIVSWMNASAYKRSATIRFSAS
mmetsp:Transcript_55921/g.63834  ORF Transcript_55921/g.63834 Transcript_55921/m.63834 type:complete len:95 (-) Transcript_55921:59-343(-)